MENSPAVGWTDVLTRQDLVDFEARFGLFEARLMAAIDRGFDHLRLMLSLVIVAGFLMNITAVIVANLLR
jgi:hypothetical protein